MTDEEYESIKARVVARVDHWIPRMHLGTWDRRVIFQRGRADGDESNGMMTWADIETQWEYLRFTLRVYVDYLWDHEVSDDALDRILVHELAHAVVSELRRFVKPKLADAHQDSEERVVSWITNIVAQLEEDNGTVIANQRETSSPPFDDIAGLRNGGTAACQ